MSKSAADLLAGRYDVDPGRIRVIPHGVPDLAPVDPAVRKPEFGLDDRPTVLSFGLVGPGKGYELAIEAMAVVRESIPDALYVILGATHPDLIRREGERYRDELRARVRSLDLGGHVRFVDRFVGRVELGRWLQASDVIVTPYPNVDQIVSGTLSYAVGAGRAVVSTPYAYARELLADGRGSLVPAGSPDALATAIAELLGDPGQASGDGPAGVCLRRAMTWPTVGAAYLELFRDIAFARPPTRRSRTGQLVHA